MRPVMFAGVVLERNYKGIVERIVDLHSDKLNTWECDFINSVYGLSDYNLLSDRQKSKIVEIHRKYVVKR
jgi:hypothetical protein